MQVQAENQLYDEVNVTPMLDLAYVLLVIFIIMCTASVQGVKVQLPKTTTTSNLAKAQVKAITVNEHGDVFLDAYPVTMDQLEQRVSQLKAGNPGQSIIIKADAKTQYAKVMQTLELLKRLDITEIGLATTRAK